MTAFGHINNLLSVIFIISFILKGTAVVIDIQNIAWSKLHEKIILVLLCASVYLYVILCIEQC